jgi:hypothetical protein
LAGFYDHVLQWFQELGCSADKMSVHGPGHSGNTVSFASANAKLKKMGFEGITDLSIFSLAPAARIPMNDYLLTASWSAKYSYACVVSRSSIVPLSRSAMLPFAKNIVQDVNPAYGIGYKRDHRLGPAMYAIGICQGLGPGGYGVGLSEAEQMEADSISRWGDGMTARIWQKGTIRDVYLWNFLTNPQLTKQVGGIPLEQWVRQEARRGTVTPLCNGVSLWEVDEANLPIVRQAIHQAGVMFDWKKHL